jgi:hypothetical protein
MGGTGAGEGLASGGADAALAPVTAPHPPQNFALSSIFVPHFEQNILLTSNNHFKFG